MSRNALAALIILAAALACFLSSAAAGRALNTTAVAMETNSDLERINLEAGKHLRLGPIDGYYHLTLRSTDNVRIIAPGHCNGYDDIRSTAIGKMYIGILSLAEGCVYITNENILFPIVFEYRMDKMDLTPTGVMTTSILVLFGASVCATMAIAGVSAFIAFVITRNCTKKQVKYIQVSDSHVRDLPLHERAEN